MPTAEDNAKAIAANKEARRKRDAERAAAKPSAQVAANRAARQAKDRGRNAPPAPAKASKASK